MPALADLPAPPPGRSGWPWTVQAPPVPAALPDGSPWPRVTIVTPSYNQAPFLEETIRSVLLQGYPDLEYIVMDGGSSDGSAAIIERYAPWLAHWVSQPDRGQSSAINLGFARATGGWLGWLNSDDCYAPGALRALVESAASTGATWASGAVIRFQDGARAAPVRLQPRIEAFSPEMLRRILAFDQPGCLWTRDLWAAAGPLDESLTYAFDWDFFIRLAPLARPAAIPATVACYRLHGAHKSGSGGGRRRQELTAIYERHLAGDDRAAFERVRPWLGALWRLKRMRHQWGRFGLFYGWRALSIALERAIVRRSPALHPAMAFMLELTNNPGPAPYDTQQGATCIGNVSGALAAFGPAEGEPWTSR